MIATLPSWPRLENLQNAVQFSFQAIGKLAHSKETSLHTDMISVLNEKFHKKLSQIRVTPASIKYFFFPVSQKHNSAQNFTLYVRSRHRHPPQGGSAP